MAKKSIRVLDQEAREEAKVNSNKKKFTDKDLNSITPKTHTQSDLFTNWVEDKSMLITGVAGTGKTMLSMWLSLRDVLEPNEKYSQLVIIRSIVPVRELGFMPGDEKDKTEMYESPYKAICDEIFPYAKSYENLKKNNYVRFESTSFLRGTTFNNSIILVDESQNMTFEELHTVITRVGNNSKIIFVGDEGQIDLYRKNDQSGFKDFCRILNKMDSFEKVHFTSRDVVRSGLVKEYLLTLGGL